MIRRLRLALSVIAYAYAGVATAMALLTIVRPGHPDTDLVTTTVWSVTALWFAGTWGVVWGLTRGAPRLPAWVRRLVDALAVLAMVGLLRRVAAIVTQGEGDGWRDLIVLALAVLTALRAVVITTPAECESFLATGLALAIWAATRLPWSSGAFALGGFMGAWLTTQVLIQLLEEAARREAAGIALAQTARTWPVLRSGVAMSFLTVALGLGLFLLIVQPMASGDAPPPPDVPAGGDPGGTRPPAHQPALKFDGQGGPRASGGPLFRIRAPGGVTRFRLETFNAYGPDGWRRATDAPAASLDGPLVRVPLALVPGIPSGVEGERVDAEILIVGEGGDALLAPGWLQEAEGPFPGAVDVAADGGLRSRSPLPAGFRYRVTSWWPAWSRVPLAAAAAPDTDANSAGCRDLPADAPPELARLAAQWAGGETSPWLRVTAIADALRRLHPYQFEFAAAPAGRDPVGWFLTDATAGNCLNFATALVLLARTAGVPARLVTGCLAHTRDPLTGEWLVAGADLHAWGEVALQGVGWVPVDATPAASWSGRAVGGTPALTPMTPPVAGAPEPPPPPVVQPVLSRVTEGAGGLVRLVLRVWPWALVGSVAGWLLWSGWRMMRQAGPGLRSWRRRRRLGAVLGAHAAACAAAARRGHPRRESQTAVEFARSVRSWAPAAADAMLRLADLATGAEFGPTPPDAETRREAAKLSRACIATFRRV